MPVYSYVRLSDISFITSKKKKFVVCFRLYKVSVIGSFPFLPNENGCIIDLNKHSYHRVTDPKEKQSRTTINNT